MPERYQKIRDAVYTQKVKKGVAKAKAMKAAKRIGAATFNATRGTGEAPVTGKSG